MITPAIRISNVAKYHPAHGAYSGQPDNWLRLDFNEPWFPPAPAVRTAIRGLLCGGGLNRYADVASSELRAGLELYTSIPAELIRVYNGSDAALRAICAAFVGIGDAVLIREPTYKQFRTFEESMGGVTRSILEPSPFAANGYVLEKHILETSPKVVYICNPNNPTGAQYEIPDLRCVMRRFPSTLFVIDEAYVEYAGNSMSEVILELNNVIITRTFSKAFGMAGLRVGYILASAPLLSHLDKIYSGKDVNVVGQVAAAAALTDLYYMPQCVQMTRQIKDSTLHILSKLGWDVISTPANFFLVRAANPTQLADTLREAGIFVRDLSSYPQLSNYVRVTVGRSSAMVYLVGELRKMDSQKYVSSNTC